MEHLRSRTGADGAAPRPPSWNWATDRAEGSASGGDRAAPGSFDEDWAATSGFMAHPHEASERFAAVPGTSGASDDASWTTESTRARTPTDGGDHHDDVDAANRQQRQHYRQQSQQSQQQHRPTQAEEEQARFRRRFKPRTCRICFETVQPTFETDVDGADDHEEHDEHDGGGIAGADPTGLGGIGAAATGLRDRILDRVASASDAVASKVVPKFLRSALWPAASSASPTSSYMHRHNIRVRYISESPEDGRLISPCHCKGSQKYVHEGCVQAWRHAQPLAVRNFWTCPTCGFEYRIQRLRWGRLVSNKATRALLTLLVFALTLFVLGFIADPLMDLWSDPSGTIVGTLMELNDLDPDDTGILGGLNNMLHPHAAGAGGAAELFADDDRASWWEHFAKGFFSLGIVGVVKTFFVVSPFTWWNLRGAGLARGRRRAVARGRERYDSMGWVFILVGAFTFLGAAWKGISFVCGRILDRASEHIVDIGGGQPDEDDEEDEDKGEDGQADHADMAGETNGPGQQHDAGGHDDVHDDE